MFRKSVPTHTDPMVRGQAIPQLCRSQECRIVFVLCAALSGFWIAHAVTVLSPDPSRMSFMILTGTLTVVSLAGLVLGIWSLLASAQSHLRHVFCGRRVFVFGGFLSVAGTTLAVLLVRRHPFGQLAASGQLTAVEIVDLGLLFAAIVCLTAAVVAFFDSVEAYREESSWHQFAGARLL